MQSYTSQDGKFGAGVEPIDVFRRIGFGEAKVLRFAQRVGEWEPFVFHPAKNVIARPVQDPADFEKLVASQPRLQSRDHGNTARHRSTVEKLLSILSRECHQGSASAGD